MKRTIITANQQDETGITDKGQHVIFSRSMWAWVDADTYTRISTNITVVWIESEGE